MKKEFRFVISVIVLAFLDCHQSVILSKKDSSFNYGDVSFKTTGYCLPIINKSDIYYDNRYTEQNYHDVDKKRTAQAFLRDFEYAVKKNNLKWLKLSDSKFQPVSSNAQSNDSFPDTLTQVIKNALVVNGMDFLVVIHDICLSHIQLIGVNEDGYTASPGYGSRTRLTFSFRCSIIDVYANKPVYKKHLQREEKGDGLDLLEKSIEELFNDILPGKK
jgi:hypothetical protein